MAPSESFPCILVHVVIDGDDVYVGIFREDEEEEGDGGHPGGDATWWFTDPFASADEAEDALFAVRAASRARRSLPAKAPVRGSIPILEGSPLELELGNGRRIVARSGQYSVVVFNENMPDEFCVVFGPGNVVVSEGKLNVEQAIDLAEKLMLADELAASIEDEVAPPSP